ncbi:TenA family transcriptional regulator [Phormidium sp. CCY1219]|uniref:TenA family transcriptional regulator n=1 Tax=Phormidium sp. CCY1219 TaxID=2886104 RepID=UPI002D1ED5EA|nr:TenA family transcriptional regulator [Phormidium sp. CCY1219]MEB3828235.1 TenA family transcriptional regulator [Phormidium sp. CCY1219]
MSLSCNQLLEKHRQLWHEATVHPFLTQCQQGTIKAEQFNTWLVQDYQFVLEFTRMLARIVAIAPQSDFDILLSGLSAIKDELNWFQAKASERSLYLDVPKQPTCAEYCDYMHSLALSPYPVQSTALWGIEFAYNQGWQLPGTMPAPYSEFADRWGNPGFTEYVKQLERLADISLETASETIQEQAEEAFVTVAKLEKDFWQMAFNSAQ